MRRISLIKPNDLDVKTIVAADRMFSLKICGSFFCILSSSEDFHTDSTWNIDKQFRENDVKSENEDFPPLNNENAILICNMKNETTLDL